MLIIIEIAKDFFLDAVKEITVVVVSSCVLSFLNKKKEPSPTDKYDGPSSGK